MATFIVIILIVLWCSFIFEWDTKTEDAAAKMTASKLPLLLHDTEDDVCILASNGSDAKWVREAKSDDTDYIFTVGGFASWQGQIGQVVAIRGRVVRLEIWDETGNSNRSTFKDVLLDKLQPVERLTSKVNPKLRK